MTPRVVIDQAVSPAPRGGLPVTVALPPGLHAILGTPADGTTAVAELVGGLVRPRSGRVLVEGKEPHREPSLRARIGVTLADPRLPDVGQVERLLQVCAETRGGDPRAMLDRLGLGALATRRIKSLLPDEARAIELAIALATPNPLLLALTEPFANVAGADRSVVLEAIKHAAMAGAAVLAMTASVADAAELGGLVHLFEGGRITRTLDPVTIAELPGSEAALCVTTSDPRALASALARHEAVSSVQWDAARNASSVTVRGSDLDRVGFAIAVAARRVGARIYAIQSVAPGLEEVRAAASGLALAAYHAAYRHWINAAHAARPVPQPHRETYGGSS